MPIKYTFNGTVTFDEYLECHKILAAKRRIWVRGIIIIYGLGILIYGLFIAASIPNTPLIIMGIVFAVYGILISPIQFRFRVKRNWDRYPKMKKEFSITVLEYGIEAIDDKGNPSHMAWDNFLRFHESKSLFLLYISPTLPLCLPKRLIPEVDLNGFRTLLTASFGNVAE